MNGLDIALIVILIFFFLRGIFRGFVKEITGIIGLFAGFFLASTYYPAMGDTLKPFIQNQAYRSIIGFEIVFLVAYFLVSLLGMLFDKLIKLSVSNVANGLLGAVIGLVKGVVLAAVVLMATTAFIRADTPFFKDSVSWPYLRVVSDSLAENLPDKLKESLKYKANQLPESLKIKVPDLPVPKEGDEKAPPWKKVEPDSDAPPPAWPGAADQ